MSSRTIQIPRGSEADPAELTLTRNGAVVDLSGATSPTLTVAFPTPLVKSAGITVAASAPNATVQWANGELDQPVGTYAATFVAILGGLDFVRTFTIEIVSGKQ